MGIVSDALSTVRNFVNGGEPGVSPVNEPHLGMQQLAQESNPALLTHSVGAEPFWDWADLDGTRWNQLYPYRLAIYSRVEGQWQRDSTKISPFTLPIPPEEMSISTPMAIVTTATLGGIVEEHNGAPFRDISMSGTTGVLPLRGNPGGPPIVTSILANVIPSSVAQLNNSLHPYGVISSFSGETGQGTGYYQFHLLRRFLESYLALKKSRTGRNFILALEVWKDQEAYLVSPVAFNLRRSQSAPLEYQYQLQLKAWRRVSIPTTSAGAPNVIGNIKSKLNQYLGDLEDARQSLEEARDILESIQDNIEQTLFTPVREAILFCKDGLGVALTAVDLPSNIQTDLQEPLLESLSHNNGISGSDTTSVQFSQEALAISDAFSALSVSSSKSESGAGRAPNGSQVDSSASPAAKLSADPTKAFSFFKSVIPSKLNLRQTVKDKITAETSRVHQLKRKDFEIRRDSVQNVINIVESAVGLDNGTYDSTYNLTPKANPRTATDTDYDLLFTLNRTIMALNGLAASATIDNDVVDTMDYFAGLATKSGIAFTVPTSKYLVPMLYGHTLEQMSLIYLGTPDRWHEIAALNGLQSPYVDEEGFQLPLLANGHDNTVVVSDVSNLYINQPVYIGSINVLSTKRHITSIVQLSSGLYTVTVDGDPDLDQYQLSASPTLQAFLPNTVNSQMSLFIPSQEEADDTDFKTKSIPGVDYFDPLVRVGGVDLLLTPQGDLVITPDGDSKLAVGLTNIVQKVRLALLTVRGSLLHHPNFGLPMQVGQSVADTNAQDILNAAKDMFNNDPTFSGVESAAILLNGPVLIINLTVGIAGTSKVIPISVEIPR